MKIIGKVFILFQMNIGLVHGLVFAKFSAVTKNEGFSSLDRYRCIEPYLGFEYVGNILSPDGSCTAVPHGWSGTITADSEYQKKTLNCNVFDVPIALFHESNSNFIRYISPIPGEVTTGLSIEIVFVPKDPWNQIIFELQDVSEINIPLHVSFRKDFNKIQFNSKVSGKYVSNENANGVEISTDKDATLTVDVSTNAFKVFVNGKDKYIYQATISPSVSRMVALRVHSGCHCLLRSICFKNLN